MRSPVQLQEKHLQINEKWKTVTVDILPNKKYMKRWRVTNEEEQMKNRHINKWRR